MGKKKYLYVKNQRKMNTNCPKNYKYTAQRIVRNMTNYKGRELLPATPWVTSCPIILSSYMSTLKWLKDRDTGYSLGDRSKLHKPSLQMCSFTQGSKLVYWASLCSLIKEVQQIKTKRVVGLKEWIIINLSVLLHSTLRERKEQ